MAREMINWPPNSMKVYGMSLNLVLKEVSSKKKSDDHTPARGTCIEFRISRRASLLDNDHLLNTLAEIHTMKLFFWKSRRFFGPWQSQKTFLLWKRNRKSQLQVIASASHARVVQLACKLFLDQRLLDYLRGQYRRNRRWCKHLRDQSQSSKAWRQ